MAKLIVIPTFTDARGSLSVIEKQIPFLVKRIYYIYNVIGQRGGHRHKTTKQALICLGGSCKIFVDDGTDKRTYTLDSPDQCLLLDAKDWHTMQDFTTSATLLVLASELYDSSDYIDEKYP